MIRCSAAALDVGRPGRLLLRLEARAGGELEKSLKQLESEDHKVGLERLYYIVVGSSQTWQPVIDDAMGNGCTVMATSRPSWASTTTARADFGAKVNAKRVHRCTSPPHKHDVTSYEVSA